MFLKQRVNDDASISYFGCGGQGKGIALDVLAGEEAWYIEQARKLNVAIAYVFDSHIHADHLSGGRTLAELAGASYTLHASNIGKLPAMEKDAFITALTSAILPRPAEMDWLIAANLGRVELVQA